METDDSVFLFEDDITNYLDEVADKAIKLYTLRDKQTPEDINQKTELLLWFDSQINRQNQGLIIVFAPYLKFKTWKFGYERISSKP